MNPDYKNLTKIPYFRRVVLQNFPFIEEDFDALTDYGFLCKVVEYLNKVIEQQNLVNDNTNSLYQSYIQLKNFVDNYFDNLDVQEEINNKLDAMAQDGTLQEIIADYLNSRAVFGFDSISDMKNATNLINGSYARTLGYYDINDGGSSLYKIRTKTNMDIEDNGTIHYLNNNLVAELIIEDNIKPELFGAIGDGTTNDTDALNLMFNKFNDKKFIFNKEYYFTNLTVSEKNIELSGGGTLKGHINFDSCNNVKIEDLNFVASNESYDNIIKFNNFESVKIVRCTFDGDLNTKVNKGYEVTNGNSIECNQCKFTNFNGETDPDILANGNSTGGNTRNKTCGIFTENLSIIKIENCHFYNILGRAGIYLSNTLVCKVLNNTFNYIYGSAVHIGNYFNNISITNNYIEKCAITGASSSDYLYLNEGKDGAIDIYGAEEYLNYLATDSNIEISNNYFYECGSHEGFSTDYYVYTDYTKTTLATHYSNGDPIGEQPLNVTTRLQCIRILDSYKANIHDNLIIKPHFHILSTNARTKYNVSGTASTYTKNTFLKVKSNKIILNDYADFEFKNVESVDFNYNTIEAFSTNNEYISTDDRSIDISTAKFLVSIFNAYYSNINNNLILSDVFAGIYNEVGNNSNVNNNSIEVWSFGIYIPKFIGLNVTENMVWVGRTVDYSPAEGDGMDSGGIYVNQSLTTKSVCIICNNVSPIITNVATNVISKSNVTGTNSGNLNTNDGTMFSFGSVSKKFPVNLPINDKYYIEYANGTRKEFRLED